VPTVSEVELTAAVCWFCANETVFRPQVPLRHGHEPCELAQGLAGGAEMVIWTTPWPVGRYAEFPALAQGQCGWTARIAMALCSSSSIRSPSLAVLRADMPETRSTNAVSAIALTPRQSSRLRRPAP